MGFFFKYLSFIDVVKQSKEIKRNITLKWEETRVSLILHDVIIII